MSPLPGKNMNEALETYFQAFSTYSILEFKDFWTNKTILYKIKWKAPNSLHNSPYIK